MIVEIDRYCRRTGTTPQTLLRVATNDGNMRRDLRNGRELTLKTIARIRQVIAENPDGIPAEAPGPKSKFR